MQNVKTEVKGQTLTITVDLSAPGNRSASGKSEVIASTHGNAALPGGYKLGLNLFKPLHG